MDLTRRSLLFTSSRLFLTAVAVSLGCDKNPVSGEVEAPGAASQIVLTTVAVAGGHTLRTNTIIDSASSSFEYTSCRESVLGPPCASTMERRAGTVLAQWRDGLFVEAQSRPFRALRSEYRRTGPVPPDYDATTLTITMNGRMRSIVRDGSVNVPLALTAYFCRIQSARGDLLLCD